MEVNMGAFITRCLLVAAIGLFLSAALWAQSYSGGSGTAGNPYQISSKADLKYLSENSGEWSKYFIQTADISFLASDFQLGGDFYNSGLGFIPIGNGTTKFTGFYDGGGNAVSGLSINTTAQFAAMFGYVESAVDSSIARLGLTDVNITNSNTFTAALVGYLKTGTVKNCYSTGSITSSSFYVGGLIGYLENGCSVNISYSTCSVSGNGTYMGGLIGYMFTGSSASNCYATGNVGSASSNTVGGFSGFLNGTITNCYSTGLVTGSISVFGFVGSLAGSGVTSNCFWNTTTSGTFSGGGGSGTAGKTTSEMQTSSTFTNAGWDFTNTWQIVSSAYPSLQALSNIYPMSVSTGAVTSYGTTTATLSGSVNPGGDTAAVRFLYGTSSGVYPDSVSAIPDTVSGNSTASVSVSLTGLSDGTKYYYKVIAQRKSDSTYVSGSELSFTTVSSVWGRTVNFGGASNQYAKAGGVATTATDNVTLEAWIKWDGTNTGIVQGIVTNGYAGTDGYGLYLYTNNKIALLVSALQWAVSDSIPPTNSWVHLAVVRNSGTWSMYMNGEAISIGSPTTNPITPYTNLFIGGDSVSYKFHGEIDEVRVSDVARYTSNFDVPTTVFVTDGNTVGLYHFDEGSGSSVDDASAQNNDLTLFNSPMWLGSNNPNIVPLPVELTSFTVSASQMNAELRWKTTTEVNNYGFEIERRAADVRLIEAGGHPAWTRVGFVEGNGTTHAPKEYSFTDKTEKSGTYSYRLKQIDRDGNFEYHQAVEVTLGSTPTVFALGQNYPNPFNPSTTISFSLPASGSVSLKVYDMIGREVAVLADNVMSAGNYSVQFNASALASGMYVYQLRSGGHVSTKKMTLMK